MIRTVGITARGIRTPIIKTGDNLVEIVVSSLKESWEKEGYQLNDRDVVGITESLVARAQGNYVTIDDIARDIKSKFPDEVGVVFPILSRNRFSRILKGIAQGSKKVYLLLSYPSDEVGNSLMDVNKMDELEIDSCNDVLTEADYRKIFGNVKHEFTGVDYIQLYKDLAVNDNIEIILANDPRAILKYTSDVLVADVHTRERTKKRLRKAGARLVLGLDDICTEPVNGSGYNREYGLLGSNTASETTLKLFPRDGQSYVEAIQQRLKEITGKNIEIMVYGDGAFKDPQGKIWELADPVVCPAHTKGLEGMPNEIKLKYFADNQLKDLEGEEISTAMKKFINEKDESLVGSMASQGATPRKLTDLLGSLCDLVSGSGDKGTPVVLVQGYFDNYATD